MKEMYYSKMGSFNVPQGSMRRNVIVLHPFIFELVAFYLRPKQVIAD